MKSDKYTIAKIILLQEGTFTYQKLADTMLLSSKTIRNQIDDVQLFFSKFNIDLIRQSGVGIRLEGNRDNILECYKQCLLEIQGTRELSSTIRKNIIIFVLLTRQKRLTMSYLEDLLYITRPSIYSDLKEIEIFLEEFEITIEKSRKSGIQCICGEKRKRKCLLTWATLLLEEDKINYYSYPDIISYMDYLFSDLLNHHRTYLRNFILNIENYATLSITHNELERMITLFLISFDRIQKGSSVNIDSKLVKKIKNQKIVEYLRDHVTDLNMKFGININEKEALYLSSLLSSNITLSYEIAFKESSNPQLIFEIIDIFYNHLQDYVNEFDKDYFRIKLFPYLEKVMQKSNFEYDLYNPNELTIQLLYPKLFKLATLINPIMKKIIDKELNLSGIATITLLLADMTATQINKLTCYYVINNNIFERDLNIKLLKNNIPNLKVVTDENIIDFSIDEIDFIVASDTISTVNKPVFIAPQIFTFEFIELLKKNIKEILDSKEKKFFKDPH